MFRVSCPLLHPILLHNCSSLPPFPFAVACHRLTRKSPEFKNIFFFNKKIKGNCTALKLIFFPHLESGTKDLEMSEWDLLEYTGGCQRSKPLECSDNKFLTMPNMHFVEAAEYPVVKNVEECKLNCLSNCSCFACSYECLIYIGTLRNLEQLSSDNKLCGDFHVRVSMGSKIKISKKVAWIVGVLIELILLIGIVSSIIWRHSTGALKEMTFSLIMFKYIDLRRATKNSQKIREGGFGSVFKGALPNSRAVAVEKMRSLEQGDKQFRAEISTIGAIQHVNLLRLCSF